MLHSPAPSRSTDRRHGPWLGLIIAVHLAFFYWCSLSRPIAQPAGDDARNPIQWLWVPMAKPATAPPPVLSQAPRVPDLRVPARAPTSAPTPTAPAIGPAAPAAAAAAAAAPPAPPAADPLADALTAPAPAPASRSADDIMQQAKRDIGQIDKDLRKQYRGAPIAARVDTAQTRLQRGFDAAAAAVPNRWYEAPKVIEVMDEGSYGRKIYKVVSPAGTYCVYVESNHAPDGIDVFQHGPNSKTASCPREK